jgi:hypothetical protein
VRASARSIHYIGLICFHKGIISASMDDENCAKAIAGVLVLRITFTIMVIITY